MKIIKEYYYFDHLNSCKYSLLQDDKEIFYISIKSLKYSKILQTDWQSESSLKKYKNMKSDDFINYIITNTICK